MNIDEMQRMRFQKKFLSLKLLHMIEFKFYIGNCRNIRGFRVC